MKRERTQTENMVLRLEEALFQLLAFCLKNIKDVENDDIFNEIERVAYRSKEERDF